MSSNLAWLIIKNNNSYLMKRRNIKKPFSTEPNNLLNVASFRYNGLVHRKSVGIETPSDKKGFNLVLKRSIKYNKPAESKVTITMKAGPRRSLSKMRRHLKKTNYRKDLIKAALRRASAILLAQKRTVRVKKPRVKKTE